MDQKTIQELSGKILNLKKERKAVILAHFYQRPEVQDVADFIGDSLGLSQQAAKTDADVNFLRRPLHGRERVHPFPRQDRGPAG